MQIAELAGFAVNSVVAKVRREVIAIAAAAACAIGAIYQGAGAAVLALEPYVGGAGARLITAFGFLVLGGIAIAIPRLMERNSKSIIAQVRAEATPPRHLQLAAILEALLFGFALADKKKPAKKEK